MRQLTVLNSLYCARLVASLAVQHALCGTKVAAKTYQTSS